MTTLLILGHLALATFLVAFIRADARTRSNVTVFCGCIGAALGLWLFLARGAGLEWRGAELDAGPLAIASAAAIGAWLLVAVLATATRLRPEDGSLVGIGATALILFAGTHWIVPALLFWLVVSAAIACGAQRRRGGASFWIVLALSDAAFVSALLWIALDSDVWRLPEEISAGPRWLLVGAAMVRAGVLPRVGPWSLLSTAPSVAIPLVVAGAFLVPGSLLPRSAVGAGLGLLIVAIGLALWGVGRSRAGIDRIAAWPSAVLLALAFVAPEAAAQAAVAAILTATIVCLWPFSRGRAQVERGLIVSLVPATAGFGAVLAAAAAAFDASNASPTVARSVPWSAVAALLPVAVASGVALGTRLGRIPEPEAYAPFAVLATWALFWASLILGILPPAALGSTPIELGRTTTLGVVAILCGAIAMRIDRGLSVAAVPSERRLDMTTLEFAGWVRRAASVASIALLAAAAGGALWLTYRGLSVGFL